MKLTTVFIAILLLLPASAKYWKATKELPYEMRALISSINLEYLTSEEQVILNESLQQLDGLIKELPQSDRYFLGKSSIYKWILQSSSSMRVPEAFSFDQIINKKDYKGLSEFSKWLLLAIRSDIINISQTPEYQRYKGERKNNRYTSKTKTIRRKIKLLAPWAFLFSQNNSMQINLQLMRYQLELLNDVLDQYKIFFHFNSLSVPKKSTKLNYFSYVDSKKESLNADNVQEPLSYLDSIIEQHKKKGLPLPQNDWSIDSQDSWSPGEDSPIEIKIETDGSYMPPKELPKPVDDWVLDY